MEKYKPVWRPATWDEAFTYIAERIKEMLKETK